ncbi:hypothetical protein BDQ17DRAFT_1430991 [Cyathus striatus]|nr:hypothetical protein BDQ17DRAFT_1430991 [Cyathus striatus]
MSSTSTVLQIPEILMQICKHMMYQKPTLASLARTCRMFEEPALDVLWHSLNGFYPLAKCLPSNVWDEKEDGSGKYVELTQPLNPIDCSRLLHHARRVRCFVAGYWFHGYRNKKRVDVSIYQALQVVMHNTKLLPNVQEITWSCGMGLDISPFIQMFLGPNLTKINFHFSPPVSSVELTVILVLREHYPLLENVTFSYSVDASSLSIESPRQVTELISSSVFQWKNLKNLFVPNLTYTALVRLSQLQNLQKLTIENHQLDNVEPVTMKGGFPALIYIAILGCGRIMGFISLLKLMDYSPVRNILVNIEKIETSSSLENVFFSINQHCCHHTLAALNFGDGCGEHGRDFITRTRDEMVESKVLKPLLDFPNLRHITIRPARGFDFTDSIMAKEIAGSWKKAEHLTLQARPFTRATSPSKFTLLDLIPFAENCPKLIFLGLPLDASNPPRIDEENLPCSRARETKLSQLLVGDSPVKNPALVAATLSGIFPALKRIKTIEEQESGSNADGADHKAWKQVEELLQVFDAVRKQERSWKVKCQSDAA